MSVIAPSQVPPTPSGYSSSYGPLVGRGQVEAHVIQTVRDWIIPYVAEYERQYGLPPRTLPVPPSPESIHGALGVDFDTFSVELTPEIIVATRPTGDVERHEGGKYGQWFGLAVAAVVSVEGDQDGTRVLADAYGAALQGLVAQQGQFGMAPDGVTPFATRTRLVSAADPSFPDPTVRDIVHTVLTAQVFVADLVSDLEGPRVPPRDPYASPTPWMTANRVEVELIRGTPDTHGYAVADAVTLDETVNPAVVEFQQVQVNVP